MTRETIALLATLVPLVAGAVAYLLGEHTLGENIWYVGTGVGALISLRATWAAVQRRTPGVDVIALLALLGAIFVGEAFAGCVIAVMLTTGAVLEAYASARAQRELALLVARSPRTARRIQDGTTELIPVAEVRPGDELVVATGEVVPVDIRLRTPGVFDESALTGEPYPVERPSGDEVRSGVVNSGPPVNALAITSEGDSTYAGLLRLVEQARSDSAPFVRLADRIAFAFVPLTLALAGLAWAIAGDEARAVAVLVVATPCPLLLAAPIAIISGISRAARSGVIIKGGGALERLAEGRVLIFDKTGTITRGRPELSEIVVDTADPDEVLRLAATVDQFSPHVLATAIVTAAGARGLELGVPHDVRELAGSGLFGQVDGRHVHVGKVDWVCDAPAPEWALVAGRRAAERGGLSVYVAVDGAWAGVLLLDDPVREDAAWTLRQLRSVGLERAVLATGDRRAAAEAVGRAVGVDEVFPECDPAGKIAVIKGEAQHGATVMVGDGINDAPALAAAGIGVALAARGATAASETADVVLNVDRVGALADAIVVSRRSRRIALQSSGLGMGLSLVAMVLAAAGLLPAAAGAVLQEGIDLLAILVALRAALPAPGVGPVPPMFPPPPSGEVGERAP